MTQLTIIIHWRGPYTIEDIDLLDGGNGLYMFTGKREGQRSNSEIQYFGITGNSYKGRFKCHKRLPKINRDLGIWLGEINYPSDHIREHLKTAESTMVYFWQPKLNERLKITPPQPTTIISHWYTTDGRPRINQKQIYKDLPDVISWDGDHWRTGNLIVYKD